MHDIPCTRYVADQNQVKVTETVYCEPDPTMLPTCHPAEADRYDAGAVFGDFKEHGHGEVEVRARRVAPAAIVVWKSVVRGTEVVGGDEDGRLAGVTPHHCLSFAHLISKHAPQLSPLFKSAVLNAPLCTLVSF